MGLGVVGVGLAILAIDNGFKPMFDNSRSTRFDWSHSEAPGVSGNR